MRVKKKNRARKISIFLVSMLVIIGIGCVVIYKFSDNLKMQAVLNRSEYSASDLDKQYGSINQNKYYQGKSAYIIYSPKTENEQFNQTITSITDSIIADFDSKAPHQDVDVLFVDYGIKTTDSKYLNLDFIINMQFGDQKETKQQHYCLNGVSGELLTLKDVCRADYTQKLKLFAKRDLELEDDIEIADDYNSFALDSENLTIYFSDEQVVTVPLKYIPELIDYPKIDYNKPMIALTFDDGPNKKQTTRLLDCLEKYDARVTFFLLGSNISGKEDIVLRAHLLGNEIASHTYNHKMLTKLSPENLKYEIEQTDKEIEDIIGTKPKLIRPPYGSKNQDVYDAAGRPIVLWSIDTEDWKTRSASATVQSVMDNAADGEISLMHDIHSFSVDAAIELIPKLIDEGYQLVTVSELAYYKGIELENKAYYRIK